MNQMPKIDPNHGITVQSEVRQQSRQIPAIFPAETVAETENVGFQFHQIYRGGIMSFHDFPRKRLRKESRIREFRMAGIGMCDGESEFQWNKRGCVVF